MKSALTIALLLLGGQCFASSITSTWNGGAGNWSGPGNWTPNTVPNNGGGNTYGVTINNSNDVVNLDVSPTIDALTLGGSSNLGTSALNQTTGAAQTLTILNDLTVNGNGTLNFSNSDLLQVGGNVVNDLGTINLANGTSLTVAGNLSNDGVLETNFLNAQGGANTITVTGALANSNTLILDPYNDSADVINAGTLTNSGFIEIGKLATLNLTNQPGGVTQITGPQGIEVQGSFLAGGVNALSNLQNVGASLGLENGQTTTVTPGGGTLSIGPVGSLNVAQGTTLTINGNVSDSGYLTTTNSPPVANTINITGALTVRAGFGDLILDSNDTLNVGSLTNNNYLQTGKLSALNLTNQPAVTDVVSGSTYQIQGSFKAGSANGFANLNSVEGMLELWNGQTNSVTPGSGTLTVSSSGVLDVEQGTTLTVNGNVANGGYFTANYHDVPGDANTINVTGQLTNNAGVLVGPSNDSADVMNVGTLANTNYVQVGALSALHLTGAGASTNTGEIELTGGTLTIAGTLDNSGTVETLSTNSQGSAITDTGTFDNNGALTLANTHDFFEANTYESGDTASVSSGALFAVGSGTPSAASGLNVLGNGTFEELLTSSSAYGQVNVQGAATLNGGELEIALANGFDPAIGSIFDIINLTPGDISGSFGSVLGQTFNSGTEQFDVVYNNSDGSIGLTVSAVNGAAAPEPASWILCLAGLGGVVLWRRRRKQVAETGSRHQALQGSEA